MLLKYHPIRFVVLLFSIIALNACAPQAPAAPTAAPQSAATPPPAAPAAATPTPVPPAAPPTPATPTATEASAPRFDGLSSGLDNAKQARIRTISEVMGAPLTDVFVNGMPAYNGGVAQADISAGQFSGWLYVTPGTYKIALVPHGGKLDQAIFAPADVKAEAGHRYTVAAIGQLDDKDVHPLVVDETALAAGVSASPTDTITIEINNVKGIDSITEQVNKETKAAEIKYGEARAWVSASGNLSFTTLVTVAGNTVVANEGEGWSEPGISYALPWFGPYPPIDMGSIGNISQGTSELSVPDFLAGFDGRNVSYDGHPTTFTTFLKLVDKAGMREWLVKGGPYFIMVPTDEAFSKLSQPDLDALLNDPQILKAFFDAHIVDGYYPSGSLSGAVYGHAFRNVTNRLGRTLTFTNDDLNSQPIGPNSSVGNGNRVQPIYTLLQYK